MEHHTLETGTESKLQTVQKDIEGLQHLSRRSAGEMYEANTQIGQIRQELEYVKADVKKLTLQMEQVYTHIRENRR